MKPMAISMKSSVVRSRIWRLVDKTDEVGGRGMTDDLIAKKCQVKSKKKHHRTNTNLVFPLK